jgi:putative ABC transport system ATP-binding protein
MLEITGYSKTFQQGTANEVRPLRNVSFTVEKGEFVVVIGANGSGKSTLLNAVAGTFPPDEGRVILDGQEITGWPEHRRAKLIGRVFQNPFSGTAPGMTIGENLAMAVRRGKFPGLGWALNRGILKEFRDRVATEHGAGGSSRHGGRRPLRRPAPGADAADGRLAEAQPASA